MNYILRIFFYSLGLTLFLAALALDPATAQFKDMLAMLHSDSFRIIFAMVAMIVIVLDLAWSGKFQIAADVAFNTVKRLREERKTKSAN